MVGASFVPTTNKKTKVMAEFNIGVSADSSVKNDILNESKKVLEAIAKKYNCKFEFYQTEIKATAKAVVSKVKKSKEATNEVGLSFCGEIDL